jgi:hypothetical protein
MGYTHYLTQGDDDISDTDWIELLEYVGKIILFCKKKNISFNFMLTDSLISISCQADDENYETYEKEEDAFSDHFNIYKNINEKIVCKTNKLPYDRVVCLILLCIKTICHEECSISSDGKDEWDEEGSNWYKAKEDYIKIFECEPICPFD